MFEMILSTAMFILSISIVVALYRLIRGETTADRILALDSIGYNIIGIVATLSVLLRTTAFLEIILIIGILAFLGTIALCKFLERGVVIEHQRNDD